METPVTTSGSVSGTTNVLGEGQQILISGAGGEQQLVMSAEDAAQFFQQAGIQWDAGSGQVIIGDVQQEGEIATSVEAGSDAAAAALTAALGAAGVVDGGDGTTGLAIASEDGTGAVALNDINDGTVLYIDPNDPQAAALLQQAGLMLSEDGTVQSIHGAEVNALDVDAATGVPQELLLSNTTEGELVETNATDENVSKQESVNLPSAPDPNVRPKDIIEESLAQSQFATEGQILEESQSNSVPIVTSAGTTQQINVSQAQESVVHQQSQSIHQPQQVQHRVPSSLVSTPTVQTLQHQPPVLVAKASLPASTGSQSAQPAIEEATSAASITVGPDQQQVFYSVTYEDGKTQQYMMLCPKEMDQNALIQTLVKQISADPTAKGKKTIRIQKPITSGNGNMAGGPGNANVSNQQSTAAGMNKFPKYTPRSAEPRARGRPPVSRTQQHPASGMVQSQTQINDKIGEILNAASNSNIPTLAQREISNVVESTDTFESVVQAQQAQVLATGGDPDQLGVAQSSDQLLTSPESGGTRVYVRCCYCPSFRSTLNSDTWEAILNHILPVCKEEIQTTFYGDLGKHFIRCVRMQVNGKQIVRSRTPSGSQEKRTPQCEVILTHSLVCRKTKREFIVTSSPDAAFVANLAKHIRMIQPGQGGRGNSLLCIFCNSPFTYEDYLRHIQPHLEPIVATLSCFAGAYCATSYETTIRAASNCQLCQEPEPADLRFLPCTKFSQDYRCLTKLQFAVECFRENYGDSGFMRLNTNSLAKCSVCKNSQQVYCAVFHITTNVLGGDGSGDTGGLDTQLCVCVNCQKQFINIVMKEQGFDERLKVFQLRNMEQLCSCLRVILGQARTICEDKRTLLYTVDESANNQTPSAVHTIKNAEVVELTPITRLLATAESEIVGSPIKAFYICDLCMFSVDLTSLIASPTASQKNDMLLSIVLEHLIPHTESLMTVVASSAANKTINIKFEIMARVSDVQGSTVPNQRKIVLSLQKKFKSQTSAMEVLIDKDEDKTISQIRAGIKAERKQYISVRPSTTAVQNNPTTVPANATQLIDVNKFIDQQRGKLGILAQCGCNTSLLNAYNECRLCSKFCFPDFRLAGNPGIELCENCVETVLTLCLPSEPEALEVAEECLALKQEKSLGHRLVLASNIKKWLSVDGVNLIKKTVEGFDNVKSADCGAFFSDALKQHLVANLKTCQNDGDITAAVTGFAVTDTFFASSKVHSDEAKADEETAAALASLSAQIGMPIRQAGGQTGRPGARQKQIEVKILARRPPELKKVPIQVQRMPQRGSATALGAGNGPRRISNGMVIDLGAGGKTTTSPKKGLPATTTLTAKSLTGGNKTITPIIHLPSGTAGIDEKDEESVSAIQSFINATSDKNAKIQLGDDLKVPKGVKITSAGKGVVNIRAVAESSVTTNTTVTSPNIVATGRGIVSPRGRGLPASRGRGYTTVAAAAAAAALPKSAEIPKGAVKTVTLTAGGIIKRAVPQGRIAGTTNITPSSMPSLTDLASPKKQVNDGDGKNDLSEEVVKEVDDKTGQQDDEDKKDLELVDKAPAVNGSKSNSVVTPNSRRGRGTISKGSPTKSISSPTQQDKDNEVSDSPVKERPKIIRLKNNSVTEVLKSTSATSANLSPSKEDNMTSKTNSTPVERNKRKAILTTPTNNTNAESPSISGSAESRGKRQRKEKKIFDL